MSIPRYSYKNKSKVKSSDHFHPNNSNASSKYRNDHITSLTPHRTSLTPHSPGPGTSAIPTAEVVQRSMNFVRYISDVYTASSPRSSASSASQRYSNVRNCVTSDYSSAGSDCFRGRDSDFTFIMAPRDRLSFSDFTASSLFQTYRLRRKLADSSAVSLFPAVRLKRERNLQWNDESANHVTTLHPPESSSVVSGSGRRVTPAAVPPVSAISRSMSNSNGSKSDEYLSENGEWISEDFKEAIKMENTCNLEEEDAHQQEEREKTESNVKVSKAKYFNILTQLATLSAPTECRCICSSHT